MTADEVADRWGTIHYDVASGKSCSSGECLRPVARRQFRFRLRSLVESVDPAGFLVRSVTADIDQAVAPALTVEQNRPKRSDIAPSSRISDEPELTSWVCRRSPLDEEEE